MIRLVLPIVVLWSGCAAHRTPAWERPGLPFGTISTELLDHMVQQGDGAFAQREDADKLDDALETWRGALRYRPSSTALLLRLSRASRLRAHLPSGTTAHAEEAVQWAERALSARNPQLLDKALDPKNTPGTVFGPAEVADVPALIAYAEALFDWAERKGMATLLQERARITAAAERALQLDRKAGDGAPDRLLGTLQAILSQDMGGSVRGSEEHFEAAVAAAPDYLPNKLEYALRYCVRTRDGKRYRRLLEEIAAADPAALHDEAPENRAAQQRARQLLKEAQSW